MRKKFLQLVVFLSFFFGYYSFSQLTGFSVACPFYLLTGLYCPGCGITRLFFALMKFQFYQAFRYNPLVFCFLIFYFFYLLFPIKLPKCWSVVALIVVILFGILRNLPFCPFLKPTIVTRIYFFFS